jgi:hypothetical protein
VPEHAGNDGSKFKWLESSRLGGCNDSMITVFHFSSCSNSSWILLLLVLIVACAPRTDFSLLYMPGPSWIALQTESWQRAGGS